MTKKIFSKKFFGWKTWQNLIFEVKNYKKVDKKDLTWDNEVIDIQKIRKISSK